MAMKNFSTMLFNTICNFYERRSTLTADQTSMTRLFEAGTQFLADNSTFETAFRNLYADLALACRSATYKVEFDIDLMISDDINHYADGVIRLALVEPIGEAEDAELIRKEVTDVLNNQYPVPGIMQLGYKSEVRNETFYGNVATWVIKFTW